MQVFHGKIITCDDKDTVAEYLVEKEGRIAYIGDELPKQYSVIPPIEIGSGAIVPAFVDAHCHYSSFSVFHTIFPVGSTDSNAKILDQLRIYARDSKENIIIGFGASDFAVSEGHLILKEQLDAVCPDKPMVVIEHDSRAAVVNSVFVDMMKQKGGLLRGFNEETGEMTQEAFGLVMDFITKGYSTRRVIENMMESADYLASRGIGLINSSSGMGFVRDYDFDMEKAVSKGLDNGMHMRVSYQTDSVSKVQKKELQRIVFCNLDGAFSNKDAALIAPYENDTNKGISYFSDEEVLNFCKEANRAGYQIALHAAGDAAFNQAVNALAGALEDYPRFDHRHLILHATLPTERGLELCSKYKIMLGIQPLALSYPNNVFNFLSENISMERALRINPLKTMLDHDIRVCFCSSAPASNPDPIQWIYEACNPKNPLEEISVYDALRMCTYYGAKANFEEKERGTLEIGKSCDLVILDKDPYEEQVENLNKINISQLYLEGKPYERSRAGAMATMIRGMFPQ